MAMPQPVNETFETAVNGKVLLSTSTDFENLIEMNARKRTIDPTGIIMAKVMSAAAVSSLTGPEANAATSPPNAACAPYYEHYKNKPIDQSPPTASHHTLSHHSSIQMDVDDSSVEMRSQSSSPKSHISSAGSGRFNKVKIVVDNLTPKTVNVVKFGMQTCSFEVNKEHMHHQPDGEYYYQHPAYHQLNPNNGYATYPPFQQYFEHNQNNQNLLNRSACDGKPGDASDESMWRPW